MTQDTEVSDATVSRILHFVVAVKGELRCRPAMVVEDFGGRSNTVNLQVFTDGSNDGPYGTDDHQHRLSPGSLPDSTAHVNLPLSLRWETSVLMNNLVRAQGTWHWPRLCKSLNESAEPYRDSTGQLVYHNHSEGLKDERNCIACVRIKNEQEATSTRRKP